MRASRTTQKKGKKSKAAAIVLVLCVLAVAVYFVGLPTIEEIVLGKTDAPAANMLTDKTPENVEAEKSTESETASDAENDMLVGEENEPLDTYNETKEEVTKELTLDAKEMHILQIGQYDTADEASLAAKEAKEKGGAGNIITIGNKYAVVLAGYPKKEAAENVKERLASKQSIETDYDAMICEKLEFSITSEEEVVTTIEKLTEDMNGHGESLYDMGVALDKGESSSDQTVNELKILQEKIENYKKSIDDWADSTDNNIIVEIANYLNSAKNYIETAVNARSDLELSSSVKYAYIGVVEAYMKMLDSVRIEQ